MKQLLNNPWVVGALCVVALITVYVRLFDSKPTPELPEPENVAQVSPTPSVPPASPTPISVEPAMAVSSQDSPPTRSIAVGWPEEHRRDPFQPFRTLGLLGNQDPEQDIGANTNIRNNEVARATPGVISLHAVFVDGPNRVAMINRELVKEGEQIHGYVVDRIQRDGVRLVGKDKPRWLEFGVVPKEPPSAS
jgi:hypothetical protein